MNAVGKSKRDILSRQLALSLLPRADAAGAAGGGADAVALSLLPRADAAGAAAAAAAGAWFEDDSARGLPLVSPSVPPVTPADDVEDDDDVGLIVLRCDDDEAR